MTVTQRMQASLILAALVAAVGVVLQFHDALLIAATIGAAGLLWSTRERKAWLTAAVLVAGGVYWSSLDGLRCSAWYRGRAVFAKLGGQIPYVAWRDVSKAVLSPCQPQALFLESLADSVALLDEKIVDGEKLEQYRTTLGDFWITGAEQYLLAWVVWELTVQSDYESGNVTVRPGDTVFDCGAHVGAFTRYALQRGAGHVIAIEPDPVNVYCLRENFAAEITSGQVTVIEAGVWDSKTNLTLSQPEGHSGSKSFVLKSEEDKEGVEGVPVLPLDDIVEQLNLSQVDFVKMDIEGSERHALRGAKRTLEQFKPRLAICTYHRPDDPTVIPAVIAEVRNDYRIHAKDFFLRWGPAGPKVLFFE